MIRLLAAAGGFTGTVIAGFVVGLLVARATGASWWTPVGILAGLALGIGLIVVALKPIVKST